MRMRQAEGRVRIVARRRAPRPPPGEPPGEPEDEEPPPPPPTAPPPVAAAAAAAPARPPVTRFMRAAAAVEIQAAWRGVLGRRAAVHSADDAVRRAEAARAAAAEDFLARASAERQRVEAARAAAAAEAARREKIVDDELNTMAAGCIQAVYRGHSARTLARAASEARLRAPLVPQDDETVDAFARRLVGAVIARSIADLSLIHI